MDDIAPSSSQLEKLGARLRRGPLDLADLQQLRSFLDTLEPFAEKTFNLIRGLSTRRQRLPPARITRRTAKTVRSIIAKLRRQTTTLRQIQDLVGCRIVVPDTRSQEDYASALHELFAEARIVDHRAAPQHGYRALHFIVKDGQQRFEIQLRTGYQDDWANLVEKIADRVGIELKYGGGEIELREALLEVSEKIARSELIEGSFWIEFEDSSEQVPWMRLWYNGDFVSVLSIGEIAPGTELLVRTYGTERFDRLTIAEQYTTWESPWGSMHNYSIKFADGDQAKKHYEGVLDEEELLSNQITDLVTQLERRLQ
ncbi:MAG TPA: RelA/SpoT domain-containing protein [Candidatus Acidoferrales bacterium]|nr:RelA/SpoT domain-containing protein [Candidatus Acidoferrales bacterium]